MSSLLEGSPSLPITEIVISRDREPSNTPHHPVLLDGLHRHLNLGGIAHRVDHPLGHVDGVQERRAVALDLGEPNGILGLFLGHKYG